jgi:beta-galactosidase
LNSGTSNTNLSNVEDILKKDGGPRLHLWRASHRNDDMWADRNWGISGIRNLKWSTLAVSAEQTSPSSVRITVRLLAEGANNFTVNHDVIYTVSGDGTIKAENSVSASDPKLVIARMGVRMFLDKKYDQVSFFGRGPMENYADRKRGFDVGLYKSTVKEQLTPYEKPMEGGNHEDVRWAKVLSSTGNGIMAQSDSSLMQVSILPYSDEEMDKVEYRVDLPPVSSTVFCISTKTLGVGSASCGPKPLPQYIIYAVPAKFTYTLKLF